MPVQAISPEQQQAFLNIIRQSFEREGGTDFNTFLRKLATILKDQNNKLIQFGQSVFLMMRKAPDMVEVHTFSVEPPPELVKAFQALAKFLKSQGMKKAVTYADNPAYSSIAKQTGLPVKMGRAKKKFAGQEKPMYTFEVSL
jgi:hypothetical protein